MTDVAVRTSLQGAPQNPTSKERLHAMRQRAWHEQRRPSFDLADVTNDWIRQIIINEANRLYGKPMKKNGSGR